MTRQSIIDGLGRHLPTRKMRRGLFCALMLGGGMTLGACASHHHHQDTQEVVVVRDEHGWEHHGYYDAGRHWHGGYYDDRHVYHDDGPDWRH